MANYSSEKELAASEQACLCILKAHKSYLNIYTGNLDSSVRGIGRMGKPEVS